MRRRHVEVFRAPNGWYFRLVHANGRKGDRSSQPYVTKWSARRGARRAHGDLEHLIVDGR